MNTQYAKEIERSMKTLNIEIHHELNKKIQDAKFGKFLFFFSFISFYRGRKCTSKGCRLKIQT